MFLRAFVPLCGKSPTTGGGFARSNSRGLESPLKMANRLVSDSLRYSRRFTGESENHAPSLWALLYAEAVKQAGGNSIVAVARRSSNRKFSGLIVEFEHPNSPMPLKLHIQPAAAHPGERIIPAAEMVESALALQIESVEAASEQHVCKRRDFVIVAERINLRSEHH